MKREDTIFSMVLPQLPAMIDTLSLSGASKQKVFATSAAILSVAAPAYSTVHSRSHCPDTQIVLMQCLTKSMPDEIVKRELREKLEEIRELGSNWIEGAQPISAEAIAHVEELLNRSHDLDLLSWEIAPYVNGTILMTYDEGEVLASINITSTGASAVIDSPTKYITIEETDFNVSDIYDIVWRLSPLNRERIYA